MSNVFPQIVSALEQFPEQQFSLLGIELKFATTIQIIYILKIQERIVSPERRYLKKSM